MTIIYQAFSFVNRDLKKTERKLTQCYCEADFAGYMQTDDRYRDVVIRLGKLDREKLDVVAAIVESMQ